MSRGDGEEGEVGGGLRMCWVCVDDSRAEIWRSGSMCLEEWSYVEALVGFFSFLV